MNRRHLLIALLLFLLSTLALACAPDLVTDQSGTSKDQYDNYDGGVFVNSIDRNHPFSKP